MRDQKCRNPGLGLRGKMGRKEPWTEEKCFSHDGLNDRILFSSSTPFYPSYVVGKGTALHKANEVKSPLARNSYILLLPFFVRDQLHQVSFASFRSGRRLLISSHRS